MRNLKTEYQEQRENPEVTRVDALCDETFETIKSVLATPGPLSTDIRDRIASTVGTSLDAYKATNRNKVVLQDRVYILEALKNTYLGALNEARAERDMLREELAKLQGLNVKTEEL